MGIATWFGIEPLYVHMINFMPITAITRELFDQIYIEKEFNSIIKPIYNNVEMAWRGYTVADRAMVDPNAAWKDAIKLISYELDSGISLSQVYYWISTMNGFTSSSTEDDKTTMSTVDSKTTEDSNIDSPDSSSPCDTHQSCADLGLKGACCPTTDEIFLGCCNA